MGRVNHFPPPMAQLRVLLGFAQAADHEIELTAGAVLDKLFGNPIYPNPPVSKAALQEAQNNFSADIAAARSGGPAGTARKNQSRATLVALLRQLALYVQMVIQGNPAYGLAELLGSGFDAVSTNNTQHPLDTPNIESIDNAGEGALALHVTPVRNARQYEVQYRLDNGQWVSAGMYNSTRGTVVTGLTPGAMYSFQVRALGGSEDSGWSNAVSHRSL